MDASRSRMLNRTLQGCQRWMHLESGCFWKTDIARLPGRCFRASDEPGAKKMLAYPGSQHGLEQLMYRPKDLAWGLGCSDAIDYSASHDGPECGYILNMLR